MDHIPVMLTEVIENLSPKAGELHLDCTFGAGGYTKAILETGASVIAVDRDSYTKQYATELQKIFPNRFSFFNCKFSDITQYNAPGQLFDGIVLDLGVSSMQLDQADRGFSFMNDGSLDMRMGQNGKNAKDFVNTAPEGEIARVIYEYGDEIASRRIAKAIVTYRHTQEIETTTQLAEIVRKAIGHRPGKIDPSTKTFQAIRIWVNDELQEIQEFLSKASSMLTVGGRIVIVTFHSLEDKLAKTYFASSSAKKIAKSKYAHLSPSYKKDNYSDGSLKILHKKPITPSKNEVMKNPRSRSAKLRSAIKLAEVS